METRLELLEELYRVAKSIPPEKLNMAVLYDGTRNQTCGCLAFHFYRVRGDSPPLFGPFSFLTETEQDYLLADNGAKSHSWKNHSVSGVAAKHILLGRIHQVLSSERSKK